MVNRLPKNQGLYNRENEHDACGIGFVADIKGRKSYDIVRRGLEVVSRMEHRGAESSDNKTGDGAGIMIQNPHSFNLSQIPHLPENGRYGTGLIFLPTIAEEAVVCMQEFERLVCEEGLEVIAWRDVPVDSSVVGEIARSAEPLIKQVFVSGKELNQIDLERKLYVIRKLIENCIRNSNLTEKESFYPVSLSTRTLLFKGMLMPTQLGEYYLDLKDERLESAIALVHSRFSTNTFPTWDLAQPFRIVAHNGEINTIKGNRFWLRARESSFESPILGDDIKKILPIIEPHKSDSASFDNVLEMLVATGRSLPHALMMLIPESFNKLNPIPDDVKYFYEYHSAFMEPWDGPASMIFCDGRFVGGTLDRNGLRPSRYVVTKDDLIVMGSEVGVQTFAPEEIAYKGRLRPGKILLVDTEEGRIIPDGEIKDQMSHQLPYREWVEKNRITLASIPLQYPVSVAFSEKQLHETQLLFGYSREDVEKVIAPMASNSNEPTGSMGTDTPLAVFSDKPQLLFNYFKQTFSQVTNPAIDPIREALVMTLTSYIGKESSLLTESSEHCKMVQFTNPIFTNVDLEKITTWDDPDFRSATLPMVFPVNAGEAGLEQALERLGNQAERLVDEGYAFIILSDRNVGNSHAPIPSLLACSSIHHHLLRIGKRTEVALVVETGEAREVMHFALLFGYGASAINPYGAFATILDLVKKNRLKPTIDYRQAEANYVKAIDKGLLKVLSKLGISTLRSYHGAQTFEALGLSREVISNHFTGTESRIGGIGMEEIAKEALMKHHRAFIDPPALLEANGDYQYLKNGETHAWDPQAIHSMQHAVRTGDYGKYKDFANYVNKHHRKPIFIRGLLDFKAREAISIDEVEPLESIFKRLNTGAMSFGSLGPEVHQAIAIAMNSIGGRSNSGEGGEDPARFTPNPDGTSARSSIKQIASGRFGVTSTYLANADELQIKIAQGAKPGEGGQLPGYKVDKKIAETRHATPGVSLISPPPHHDIYSIEDLKQLIFDLKNSNPLARISVKLVSVRGVGTIATGVAKAYADNIVVSGYEGGTGASPQSSIRHSGLPMELGISETHQTLVINNLRGRVKLQTDGQLKTGRDIVIAAMLGAEEFGFGTASLISMGCIMMRKCHLNTCPVGVATQNEQLRKKFAGEPKHLINYLTFVAQEAREIMASLGIRTFDELVGRTDLLQQRETDHWKAKRVDLSAILYRPAESEYHDTHCVKTQPHKIEDVLDRTLIQRSLPALDHGERVSFTLPITNVDRAVGTMLSYEVSKRYADEGLPENSIEVTFNGSAGQSFGAFVAPGISFRLQGESNDYFGKGLSGGRLVVVPPEGVTFAPEENIIVGNTVLYGATSGEAFIRGIAGERFGVRNSGAIAVVEGTGDHGAEYMTGGTLLVLGKVGRNFAAGMSGGIAYVLNNDGDFSYFCNQDMVDLIPCFDPEDQTIIQNLLRKHLYYTDSNVAKDILANWHRYMPKFIKVMPIEYKRALEEMKREEIAKQIERHRVQEELGVAY